jgi:predicted phosphodiesterase
MAIEKEHDIELISFNARQIGVRDTYIPHNKRIVHYDIEDGLVFIASDAHYWPGEATIAHQAFIKLLKRLKPKAIIMNGDVFDGATTSRHDPIYKYQTPTAAQEIEACKERLGEIERTAHNARLFWTIGNHDTRLFRFIQANAEAVACVPGTDIFDYFPGWITCWRLDINKSTVVKHRWHGGIHATHNNAMKSMLPLEQGSAAFVTGHLHKLCVTPFRGIAGTVWGVDSGTLAEPKGEQFAYLEENPVNWASGFVVLTFKGGKLTPPEICEVVNGHAYFRGERIL